jgi:hypothetical protein
VSPVESRLHVDLTHFGGILSIVYILTNEAMPGYIKIGRTGTSVEQRMRELDKTSTPLPFQCYYAARVDDDQKLERTLHAAFGDHRVRSSREFFRLDPYKARVVIELLALEDVTPRGDLFEDAESEAAVQKANKSTGRYSFSQNEIPVGSILEYVSDRSITCSVSDDNNVIFDDQVVSPSRAAVLANTKRGGSASALSGPISWLFEGQTLSSIREERLQVDVD